MAQWWGQAPHEHMIVLVVDQGGNFQPSGVAWTAAPCQLLAPAPAPAVATLQAKVVDTQAAPHAAPQPARRVEPVQLPKTPWCELIDEATDLDTTPRDPVPTLDEDGVTLGACEVVSFRPSSSAARRVRRKQALERRRAADPSPQLDMKKLRSMLDHGDVTGVAKLMRGQVYMLARHPAHCRMLQEVLVAGSSAQELVKELQGYVWELATCPHGNFTVQKVISHLSPAASEFVARELRGYAVQAAKHAQACRILCRLLEFRGSGSGSTWYLIEELLEVVGKLCTHRFAHHVIQSVLEHGEAEHRQRIADVLLLDGLRFATNKHCSYLIEKMLCYCSVTDQEKLIHSLGTPEMLLELATTQYGSFVARALLRDHRLHLEGAMWIFERHQKELEQSKYGLRFLSDLGLKSY